MKQLNFIFSLWLLFLASACSSSEVIYSDISQQQLLEKSASSIPQLILDVRTAEEFAEGHIPQAVNISHEEVASKITEITRLSQDRSIPVIVYCRSGRRAGLVLEVLQNNGFTKIYHLEGDMNGWEKAKQPVEK